VIQFYEDSNCKINNKFSPRIEDTILVCWSNPQTWVHKVDVFLPVLAIPFGKKDLKRQFKIVYRNYASPAKFKAQIPTKNHYLLS